MDEPLLFLDPFLMGTVCERIQQDLKPFPRMLHSENVSPCPVPFNPLTTKRKPPLGAAEITTPS